MRVLVTGATGVLGTSAVRALLADGHEVSGLARGVDKARTLEAIGVQPVRVRLFDVDALTHALAGFEAVCNLATAIPVGLAAVRPGAWRVSDRLRTHGSRMVARAAEAAGVRRLVQESVSFLYADAGDEWITESSSLAVTRALEPATVAETNALSFAAASREAVVLRFGNFVGDDAATRWWLDRARAGRPVGLGRPQDWAHMVHPEDAGAAVAAALHGPFGGIYNVGADPVRRETVLAVFSEIVKRPVAYLPRLALRMGGDRLEPLTRSHRISSTKLHEMTGWKPAHPVLQADWVTSGASA